MYALLNTNPFAILTGPNFGLIRDGAVTEFFLSTDPVINPPSALHYIFVCLRLDREGPEQVYTLAPETPGAVLERIGLKRDPYWLIPRLITRQRSSLCDTYVDLYKKWQATGFSLAVLNCPFNLLTPVSAHDAESITNYMHELSRVVDPGGTY